MSSSPRGSWKHRAAAVVAPTFLALTLAGCGGGGGGDVAQVNDQKISRSDYEAKLEGIPQAKQVLAQIIQTDLIEQYGQSNHIDVTDAEIDKKLDDVKSRYPAGQFDAILKQQGLSENDVRNILKDQIILQKAVPVKVSDADIRAYLAKNHATLDTPEQVRAKHILVADLATAMMVESKLKSGGDFAALAKQYSTDPSNKDKGGELGLFGRQQMVPTFAAAAFTQKVGVVGPPVKSPFGYHIIVVEEHKPAAPATFASSEKKIRDLLEQQQQQAQIPLFLQSLRQKANIQIFDEKLKDALPPLPAPPPSAAQASSAAAPATAAPAAPSPAAS